MHIRHLFFVSLVSLGACGVDSADEHADVVSDDAAASVSILPGLSAVVFNGCTAKVRQDGTRVTFTCPPNSALLRADADIFPKFRRISDGDISWGSNSFVNKVFGAGSTQSLTTGLDANVETLVSVTVDVRRH